MSKRLSIIKRTSHAQSQIVGDYETPEGKSLTVQDDSMSIREMFARMATVQPLYEKDGEEVDFDDPDMEKIGRADVNTQMRIHANQVEKVVSAKKKIKEAEDEIVKREKEAKKVSEP